MRTIAPVRARSHRRLARHAALLASVSLALLIPSAPAATTQSMRHEPVPGVELQRLIGSAPALSVHVARIAPGAPVALRPVLANDRLGDEHPDRHREATSAMCARVGGIVCVNADFAACPTCRQPAGGVVVDGRPLRSFRPGHRQVSVHDEGYTWAPLEWHGRLVATFIWLREVPLSLAGDTGRVELRRETHEVPLAGLNVDPVPDGAVLYLPDWGTHTPPGEGRVDMVIATAGAVAPGIQAARPLERRTDAGEIPGSNAVVAAHGRAATALDHLWTEWHRTDADELHLALDTRLSPGVRQSIGAHPLLVHDGQRAALDPADPMVTGRHPRTLMGWTASGELLLVTVDGRQPRHSVGVTLYEAADLLLELGAVHGLNLDGGGSSTFVGPCPTGPCVMNRPSDRRERLVPVALAVVPDGSTAADVRPLPPPPEPPPPPAVAPPTEADPASTLRAAHTVPDPAHAGLPAAAAPSDGGSEAVPAISDDAAPASGARAPRLPELPHADPTALALAPSLTAAEPATASSPLLPVVALALLAAGAALTGRSVVARRQRPIHRG